MSFARARKRALRLSSGFLLLAVSCTAQPAPAPRYPALPGTQAAARQDNDDSARRGGRLYDNFFRELALDFVPDDPKTPALDGRGGPAGNGTLPDAEGKPIANPGHDYRLVNLLGADLRGATGISGQQISGQQSQAGTGVLLPDLLKNTDTRETWRKRLTEGEDAIPAYGKVLAPDQIEALLDFLLSVRDGTLPQPDQLFTLDATVPGFYRLAAGGDAARGKALYAATCTGCHGADGTAIAIGPHKHSLGTELRSDAGEAWLKILVGVPGTKMGPQLKRSASRNELTQALLDLFAAGCDRQLFPKGQADDVADGDARCGSYLK
jgi:cytochrome c5